MDRVNSPGHIVVDGKRQFYDGDPHPQPDRPATVLQAEFLNSVQDEICGFIESEGIELNALKKDQLKKAIRKTLMAQVNPTITALRKVITVLGYHAPPTPPENIVTLPELITEIPQPNGEE